MSLEELFDEALRLRNIFQGLEFMAEARGVTPAQLELVARRMELCVARARKVDAEITRQVELISGIEDLEVDR